jgi:hypothetical protein
MDRLAPSDDLRWVRLWAGFSWPVAQLRRRRRALVALVPAVLVVAYSLSPDTRLAPVLAPSLVWLYLSVVAVAASREDAPGSGGQAVGWWYAGLLGATSVLAGAVYLVTALLLTLLVALTAAALFTLVLRLWWRWSRPVRRSASSHHNANGRAKIAYHSEAAARTAAVQYRRDTGEQMNAYRCGTCPSWHIGHAR